MANTGKDIFDKVIKSIPTEIALLVPSAKRERDWNYVKYGRVYERILRDILTAAMPEYDFHLNSKALIPVPRAKRMGGYLHPDVVSEKSRIYIEVTTWGDSNMIFSKIMQGFLLKMRKDISNPRYFVRTCLAHRSFPSSA